MGRNLNNVIDEIVKVLPSDVYNKVKSQLDDIKSSYSFAAPEMQSFWWGRFQDVLYDNISSKPEDILKEGYELDVWSILSTMSKESILKSLKNN